MIFHSPSFWSMMAFAAAKSMFFILSSSLNDALESQDETDDGRTDEQADQHGPLGDRMISAAGVLHQRSAAENADDRFIQEQGQPAVQPAFEQVERQDAGNQDADDRLSGHAEIDRRDDIIPQQHAE